MSLYITEKIFVVQEIQNQFKAMISKSSTVGLKAKTHSESILAETQLKKNILKVVIPVSVSIPPLSCQTSR